MFTVAQSHDGPGHARDDDRGTGLRGSHQRAAHFAAFGDVDLGGGVTTAGRPGTVLAGW
jgi:hypothetical protein